MTFGTWQDGRLRQCGRFTEAQVREVSLYVYYMHVRMCIEYLCTYVRMYNSIIDMYFFSHSSVIIHTYTLKLIKLM